MKNTSDLGVKGIVTKAESEIDKAFESQMSKTEKREKISGLTLDCCRDLTWIKDSENHEVILDAIENIITT